MGASAFLLGIACYGFDVTENVKTSLNTSDIEALSSCEIYKENNNTLLLQCMGEEGRCITTKWGYVLECSGKKVYPTEKK